MTPQQRDEFRAEKLRVLRAARRGEFTVPDPRKFHESGSNRMERLLKRAGALSKRCANRIARGART